MAAASNMMQVTATPPAPKQALEISVQDDFLVRAPVTAVTPQGPRMGRLSPLDVVLFGFGVIPHVFFFKERLDPDQLMAGLSAALERFPMFAGRLSENKVGSMHVWSSAAVCVQQAGRISTGISMPKVCRFRSVPVEYRYWREKHRDNSW